MNKKELGKFYTVNNPFELKPFRDWFNSIPDIEEAVILEPFAGANNIVKLMNVPNQWKCYDIYPCKPSENQAPEFKVIKRDTVQNFPKGYSVCITNPPYLAKNSATRNKIVYQGEPYDDLYKKCLDLMLKDLDYIAAIIPESFITAGIFTERLSCVISLTCKMFDDTDCPVCLAIFDKERSDDFYVYRMEECLGAYNKSLIWYKPIGGSLFNWKINDPSGEIGIICVDNTSGPSIQFVEGNTIKSEDIKDSSRSLTRVSISGTKIKDLKMFLYRCNQYLTWYRENTQDVFMTSFKGLRKDGKYRRRLDFETAKAIMSTVLINYKKDLIA